MFTTGAGKRLTFSEVVESVRAFNELPDSKIIVGADSQKINKRRGFSFVTVVCCITEGKGAHYFYWKKYRKPHRNMQLQAELSWKMWQEAEDITKTILALIKQGIDLSGIPTHHDLGYDGESRNHIKGILGMMKAYGYKPEIKPNSFVADAIADKHSKH